MSLLYGEDNPHHAERNKGKDADAEYSYVDVFGSLKQFLVHEATDSSVHFRLVNSSSLRILLSREATLVPGHLRDHRIISYNRLTLTLILS